MSRWFVFVVGALGAASSAFAQDHTHGAPLHLSHPLIAESPSPDTKIRFDYIHFNRPGDEGRQHTARFEGEYAFTPSLSVEIDVPYTYLDPDEASSEHNLDNTEIGLKYANFALAEKGLLLGGGLELGLPTGDDAKGIGSNNVVEVEPFIDFGYKQGRFEAVGFLAVGFPVNENDENEADREYEWNLSLLYHLTPWIETLLELDGEIIDGGEEDGFDTASFTPGIKIRPLRDSTLRLGAGVRLPLATNEKEFHAMAIGSVFYHF